MANRSTTGFGLRAAMRLGNTASIQGQSKYAIKSGLGVGILKNNPASMQLAGDTDYIQWIQASQLLMMVTVVIDKHSQTTDAILRCAQWCILYRCGTTLNQRLKLSSSKQHLEQTVNTGSTDPFVS